MSTSTWGMTIENNLKQVLAYGSTVASAQLTRSLNAPAELTCDLAITGQDTKALFAQLDVGAVYARVAEGSTTRFFGVLTDAQVSLSDSGTVSVTFMDLSQQYATSYYYITARSPRYQLNGLGSSSSGTTMVTTLAQTFLSNQSVLLPLTVSGTVGNVLVTEPGTEVSRLELLDALASIESGLDWVVDPDQTIRIASTLGVDRSKTIKFQFGDIGQANVTQANVQYLPPRNRVLQSLEDGYLKAARVSDSSVAAYGAYETLVPRLARGTSSETDAADQILRTSWRRTLDLELEPSLAPRPWTDFEVGDTVDIRVDSDAFTLETNQRVNQIVFSFNDQFTESGLAISMEVK